MTWSSGLSRAGEGDGQVVVCVSSTGGHFVQLTRIAEGLGTRTHFVSTRAGDATLLDGQPHHVVRDISRSSRWSVLVCAVQLLRILWRVRPSVVLTTGAAPGYLGLIIARRLGARTVWIDSVANVERVSMAGQLARKHADLFLVQWPHLADAQEGRYMGSVL